MRRRAACRARSCPSSDRTGRGPRDPWRSRWRAARGHAWGRAAANEPASLELGDDGVHRLGRDERPARQLGARHAVVLTQHAERHVLRRGDAVVAKRLVQPVAQPSLDAVHRGSPRATESASRARAPQLMRRLPSPSTLSRPAGAGGPEERSNDKVIDNDVSNGLPCPAVGDGGCPRVSDRRRHPCGTRGELVFAPLLASMVLVAALAAAPAAPATPVDQSLGTTTDGGSWVGTCRRRGTARLLLYSHGSVRRRPPTRPTRRPGRLSSTADTPWWALRMNPTGSWWALGSASTRPVRGPRGRSAPPPPVEASRVLAFGTSMGGRISALESERGNGRIDGALTTAASSPARSTSTTTNWTASTRSPRCWRGRCRSSSCASPPG